MKPARLNPIAKHPPDRPCQSQSRGTEQGGFRLPNAPEAPPSHNLSPREPAPSPATNQISARNPSLVLDSPFLGKFQSNTVDLRNHRPSRPLLARKPARFWLRHCAIPWVQFGDTTAIAFGDAATIGAASQELTESFGTFIPVLAPSDQIHSHLLSHFSASMARNANASLPAELSSRSLFHQNRRLQQILPFSTLLTLIAIFPAEIFTLLCALALGLLGLFICLKLVGLSACLSLSQGLGHISAEMRAHRPCIAKRSSRQDLPLISVLVPLYNEAEISSALLKRLKRLTYPTDRLEVLLVLEEEDAVTRRAIEHSLLPPWISVVQVPVWGDLRTKPRAMNYALNFCRGDIIGVWDAEDAPQPDQLFKVAQSFAAAPDDVACFQGVLDYYNPRANWISRCFTLEYASWFRVVLQGIAQLELVVPLGGTTMFVRRQVLEELGGWDAHNVTEDADLGVRLFRAGYRTRMLPTTTFEEASCTIKGWVRQRSRWLKGFMATYLVHMRQPAALLRDLGIFRFLGFQAFFLGTLGQFLLAPFLWSFWLVLLGLPHPSADLIAPGFIPMAVLALLGFELLGIAIAATAAFACGRPGLALWAPCLSFYFMMGAVAAYKALYELIFHPFYWDKTSHGLHQPDPSEEAQFLARSTPAE